MNMEMLTTEVQDEELEGMILSAGGCHPGFGTGLTGPYRSDS